MSSPTSPPPSHIPGAPSGGGGAIYVAAIVVLLLGIGGVVWMIRTPAAPPPAPPKPAKVAPSSSAAALAALPDIDPPPPPPPEPDAGAADAGTKVAVANGGPGPCSGACNGSVTPALESALRGRGSAARGCYERALRQNSMLAGKMSVSVRVDASGSACAVSIGRDEIHSGEVTSCVLGMFRGQKFPPPSGGCAEVSLPLSFEPKEK